LNVSRTLISKKGFEEAAAELCYLLQMTDSKPVPVRRLLPEKLPDQEQVIVSHQLLISSTDKDLAHPFQSKCQNSTK
jgi:hypothetical protein